MTVNMRVMGVPEHFNAPWKIAESKGRFAEIGANVSWTDCYEGTGAMCKALSDGSVDVALLLTEGAIVHALKDIRVKLYGIYVRSPLVWGIHVGSSSSMQKLEDMKDIATFAISRYNSGSHLMAFVLATRLGWDVEKDMRFEVVNNIHGAQEALKKDGKLVFMWEKFTTDPYVKSGEFRRIGEQPTPWPCFVIAVRESFVKEHEEVFEKVISVVKEETDLFHNGGEATLAYIKEHHQIQPDDARLWLQAVEWECSKGFANMDMISSTAKTLSDLGRIPEPFTAEKLQSIVFDT